MSTPDLAVADSQGPNSSVSASYAADGRLVSFGAYLRAAARPQASSAHWPSSAIAEARRAFPHGERGTVALVSSDVGAEAAPGISLTVQIVSAGRDTSPHRHAFWHLYVIASGRGMAYVGGAGVPADEDVERAYPLVGGDALYVPPWAAHRFVNPDPAVPLVLYALQNLPQLAALGTLVREAPDGGIEHVYLAPRRTSHSS